MIGQVPLSYALHKVHAHAPTHYRCLATHTHTLSLRCNTELYTRTHAHNTQIYKGGAPSAEAGKQGAQPVVDDSATTALVVDWARSMAGGGVAPS